MTNHQQKQIEVINKIEGQIKKSSLNFSTVKPVEDFENDSRMTLTGVHLPSMSLASKIQNEIISPLTDVEPDYYYYTEDNLHLTIKSIRVINDPGHFTSDDISKAEAVFACTVPKYKKFNVYFYRLLLFPNNLALIGTTDGELDSLVLDLDQKLKHAGIPDDKRYVNSKYFFSNVTLARFSGYSEDFKKRVEELSESFSFDPYTVDSVSLLTCNAVLKKREIINSWNLK